MVFYAKLRRKSTHFSANSQAHTLFLAKHTGKKPPHATRQTRKSRKGARGKKEARVRKRKKQAGNGKQLGGKSEKQTDDDKKETGKSKFPPLIHAFCKADNTFVY